MGGTDKQIIQRIDRRLDTSHSIVVPVIHMNGDSRERLIGYRETVLVHLRKAQETMSEMSPNERNYYPSGPDLFESAVEQHRQRAIALHTLIEDIDYELAAITDDTFDGDDTFTPPADNTGMKSFHWKLRGTKSCTGGMCAHVRAKTQPEAVAKLKASAEIGKILQVNMESFRYINAFAETPDSSDFVLEEEDTE